MFEILTGSCLLLVALFLIWNKYRILLGGKKTEATIVTARHTKTGKSKTEKGIYVAEADGKRVFLNRGIPFYEDPKKRIGQKVTIYINPKDPQEAVQAGYVVPELLALLCILVGLWLIFSR